MDKIQYILWCVLFLGQHLFVVNSAKDDNNCPEECFCNVNKIVYCSRRGLTHIPSQIPSNSQQLNLNGNIMQHSFIQRRNVSRFVNLEHLYLSECGLERIEVGAFTDLIKLKWLDLSSNRIKILEDFTFQGLTLSHLFLNGNRNLNIKRNAFANFETSGLYLQECSLSKLNLDVFEHLNNTLTNLWLNDNELVSVNRRFLPMFSRLTHVRLGSNPFHCNCELSWLKQFYDANDHVFEDAGRPSCLSPARLKSKQFNNISEYDFTCQPPSFRNIDAIFKGSDGMLRCTASGDPSPLLYWVKPSGVPTVYKPPSNYSLRYNEAVLNISAEHTPQRDLSGSYFCVALNEAGNMTFTFNLTWPMVHTTDPPTIKVVPKLEAADSASADQQHPTTVFDIFKILKDSNSNPQDSTTPLYNNNNDDDDSGIFINIDNNDNKPKVKTKDNDDNDDGDVNADTTRDSTGNQYTTDKIKTAKRYSLGELIGAILGTFFATLLLCIIIIPLYFRRRWKNNNSPHHSLVATKSNLQETMYLNGSGSRGPQLPPRPPGHNFTYFDSTIQSLNNR